jgi:uncharacterized protein YcfJ
MKTVLLLILAGALVVPARAQLFGPESLTGALLGGVAGGVIGHNNGRKTAEGAAIGAGVGAVLGAIVGNERRAEEGYPTEVVYSQRPPHAVTGAVLGGIAGGVIGHNNGRHTAEGIAIGAGAGLLLGTLADQQSRSYRVGPPPPRYVAVAQPSVVTVSASVPQEQSVAVASAPAGNVILRNYPGTASASDAPTMGGANALFGR